ncbi:MAG: hypothetical protein PHR79_10000 [Bacteroidales bacterium]|nr:hypothetical protein [Bacteroidales bacterium]MDY0143923.1 hypothetical protein [Bacteroidales bacterium]
MNYIVEILIAGSMIFYVLFEIIRINLFKKSNNALSAGLISMLLLGFGIYLLIKYGLIVDYGADEEVIAAKANWMFVLAILSVFVGLVFIFISIIKLIVWKIKKIR